MDAPLSNYWAVEYHFNGDAFSVRTLPDYLTHSQRAFRQKRLFVSVILSLHPTRSGADEACEHWQQLRNKKPLSWREQAQEFRRYLDGLESAAKEGER